MRIIAGITSSNISGCCVIEIFNSVILHKNNCLIANILIESWPQLHDILVEFSDTSH